MPTSVVLDLTMCALIGVLKTLKIGCTEAPWDAAWLTSKRRPYIT